MSKKIISAYAEKERCKVDCGGESRTKQQFKDDCDIGKILKRYEKTGVIEHMHENAGFFEEVSPMDFQQSMDIVANAKSMFEALPSEIRSRFDNDPKKLLTFMDDEKNIPEGRELGLIPPESSPKQQSEELASLGTKTPRKEKKAATEQQEKAETVVEE